MAWILYILSALVGAALTALIIRNNPERAIAWLNKVTAKAKAKAEAKWAKLLDR